MHIRIPAWTVPLVAAILLFLLPGVLQAQAAVEEATRSWTGKLVDAACKTDQPTGACDVSLATRSFGLVDRRGVLLKFDRKGNDMTKEQLQATRKEGSVQISVTGRMSGDTIQVEAIEIR